MSPADRLLSTGFPIVVAGGEVRLRFTLLALARCEAAYGSLAGIEAELRFLAAQLALGFPAPTVQRVADLLQHTLGHDSPVDAENQPGECIEALIAAWQESFPPASDGPGKA